MKRFCIISVSAILVLSLLSVLPGIMSSQAGVVQPEIVSSLVAAGMTTSIASPAGDNVWTSNGPYGGTVLAFSIDPVTPSTLLAGTEWGLYGSTSSGDSWERVEWYDVLISDLVRDPQTATTLYATTNFVGKGIIKSIDNGMTWTDACGGLPSNAYPEVLAIDPHHPTTVYAAGQGVFKSTDGGAHWSAASTGLPATILIVRSLAIDPQVPATLYVGATWHTGTSWDFDVYKSTDYGASWSVAGAGLPEAPINTLAIDPQVPTILYAGTGSGVFKSTDGGAYWFLASTGLPYDGYNLGVLDVAMNPHDPTTLYAGTGGTSSGWHAGLFKSTDGGGSWSQVVVDLTTSWGVTAIAISPQTDEVVFIGTDGWGGGVTKSTDGGASWNASNTGLTATPVRAVLVDPTTPTVVYAGTENGVFKSTDSGASWQTASQGLSGRRVFDLVMDTLSIYAGLSSGLFMSNNGGGIWWPSGVPGSVDALALVPGSPGVLYAGMSGYSGQFSVFRMVNGNPFLAGLPNQQVRSLAVDPSSPSTVYAGTYNNGVFKTTNSGGAWTSTASSAGLGTVEALLIDPTTPATLYAGAWGGVFRSVDGGANWNRIASWAANALKLDPRASSILYAGGPGVVKSINGGGSWSYLGPPESVNALSLDPQNPTILHAGTNHGVFSIRQPDAPITTARYSSQGVELNWVAPVNPIHHYEIYRSVSPYFAPGKPSDRIGPDIFPPDNEYIDLGAFSPPGASYFYIISAIRADGSVYSTSNEVGVFGFRLVPGE